MPKRTFAPEQIVTKLPQIEVLVSQGEMVLAACKEAGITAQTFYHWLKEDGGLQVAQAKEMKDLGKGNAQLRRAIAELTLEKQMLKDIAEGNSEFRAATPRRSTYSGKRIEGTVRLPVTEPAAGDAAPQARAAGR